MSGRFEAPVFPPKSPAEPKGQPTAENPPPQNIGGVMNPETRLYPTAKAIRIPGMVIRRYRQARSNIVAAIFVAWEEGNEPRLEQRAPWVLIPSIPTSERQGRGRLKRGLRTWLES